VPIGVVPRQAFVVSEDEPWYAVRCVFAFDSDDGPFYEERVTIWRSDTFDDAVALAEAEASEYATTLDAKYVGVAQAFHLAVADRPLVAVDEVFSLMRRSELPPSDYLDRFFSDGGERQRPL
jgi:hypothetical protein